MHLIKYLLVGFLFGVIATKSEIISWYRIYEMFHFQSFHMYGIIGTAVVLGCIQVFLIKKFNLKDLDGAPIKLSPKTGSFKRYLYGGIIFGLGWGLVGACPGPMFILLGHGYISILIVIFSAILGTFVYGVFRDKLPM